MKLSTLILVIGFLIIGSFAKSQTVQAVLGYNEFYSPKDGQYIESYVGIEGSTLQWVKDGSSYSSSVELTVIFRQDSIVMAYSKDVLNSKALDSAGMAKVFMHSSRYLLKNGDYKIDIKIDDLNDTVKGLFNQSDFTIDNNIDSIYLSSIEVAAEIKKTVLENVYSKNGFDITPNIYRYLGEKDSVLQFYTEIYNTAKVWQEDATFLMTYYIVDNTTFKEVPNFRVYKRKKAKDILAMIGSFDISKLHSGRYTLVLELRDKNNLLISANDYFFTRHNPNLKVEIKSIEEVNIAQTFAELIRGTDTLSDIIKSFRPISNVYENEIAERVIRDSNEYVMQQFVYSFWEKRNIADPFKDFKEYMERIRECDKLYATRIMRGYETDRGRVFIQYGKANSIAIDYNDPASYPYEIWHYYQARGQRNIKFIFYNTDLITNNFELLHSTAYGERSDYQWRLRLRRDEGFDSIDDGGKSQDDWGSQYNQLYEDPR